MAIHWGGRGPGHMSRGFGPAPSLWLDFLSGLLDGRISFTRTSAATYVNSAGNVVTTPASKNLLTFTEEFDSAAWGKSNATVTANSVAAPDGLMTADTLVPNNGATDGNATQVVNGATASVAYTLSYYVKSAGLSPIRLRMTARTSGNVFISDLQVDADLSVGTVGTVTAGTFASTSASITSVGDGWYRISLTGTTPATTSILWVSVRYAPAGNGTSGIYLWGAQLETGSTATSYTRNFGGLFPPRFDYDPVTLQPRGLLIEEQRTNLLTYSEDWTNAAWSKVNITVTSAATTSPDGTVDAQKIEATATAATSVITPTVTVAATSVTFSVYVKQGTGATTAGTFTLRNDTSATNLIRGTLNYSTGAFTYITGSTGVTVVSAGNGWWRIVMTATSGITSGDTIRSYVGFDGGSQTAGDHLFAWGAQLEAGSFATSYIPTVASQVTRTADQASIVAPNFAPWYNQSEGTFVVEVDSTINPTVLSVFRAAAVSDGTSGNAVSLFTYNAKWGGNVTVGGVIQCDLQQNGSYTANVPAKVAMAYKANDFAVSVNGLTALTDTSGSIPTVDRLSIGSINNGGHLNGHIRRISYYPSRLSNAQLQALSA